MKGAGDAVEQGRSPDDGDDRPDEKAHELAEEDGARKNHTTLISKTPAANSKSLTGKGGGIMAGIRMARNSWFSKRSRKLLVALAVDALEQEELAAGAADVVGEEAADGGAERGHEAVEDEVRVVVRT